MVVINSHESNALFLKFRIARKRLVLTPSFSKKFVQNTLKNEEDFLKLLFCKLTNYTLTNAIYIAFQCSMIDFINCVQLVLSM